MQEWISKRGAYSTLRWRQVGHHDALILSLLHLLFVIIIRNQRQRLTGWWGSAGALWNSNRGTCQQMTATSTSSLVAGEALAFRPCHRPMCIQIIPWNAYQNGWLDTGAKATRNARNFLFLVNTVFAKS